MAVIRLGRQQSAIHIQVFTCSDNGAFPGSVSRILSIVFSRTERIIRYISWKGYVLSGVAPGATGGRGVEIIGEKYSRWQAASPSC